MQDKLKFVFGAQTREFDKAVNQVERGIDRVSQSTKSLGRTLGAAFTGVSFVGFANFTREATQFADAIAKMADKVGLSTEGLQRYRYAADNAAGVTSDQLDTAMQRFSRRVGEAANGTGQLKGLLEQYGIAVHDSAGNVRSLESIPNDLANATKGASTEQEQLRIAFNAFDSEGAALVNLLRLGAEGMQDLGAEARALEDGMVRTAELYPL